MIDNQLDTNNIKLSPEQTQAIEESKKRLLNLENEISIANKVLKTARTDSEKAIKENSYQGDLLKTIIAQLNEKKVISTKLDEDILEKTALLNQLLVEFKAHSDKITAENMELKDREDKVSAQEEKLSEHEQAVLKIGSDIEKEEVIFDAKVAKLKEIISTF